MILGSLPFVIYIQFIHGKKTSIFQDDQIKLFLFLLLLINFFTIIWVKNYLNTDWYESIRLTVFNITSILTGTGYTSSNYNIWGGFGLIIFPLDFAIKCFQPSWLLSSKANQLSKVSKPTLLSNLIFLGGLSTVVQTKPCEMFLQ